MINSFIKLNRTGGIEDLIRRRNTAFVLLTIIALRAKRSSGMQNFDELEVGECYIGDFESYGVTRQIYRSDLKLLKTNHQLTIRTTSRGTIVKLTDTSIFDINEEGTNHPPQPSTNHQSTINQPSTNQRPTTNKNDKNVRMKERNKPVILKPVEEATFANKVQTSSEFEEFKKHRIKLRDPMTDYAQHLLISKVEKLSGDNLDTAKELLNTAIERGWKSVFPPNNLSTSPPKNNKRFENERGADYYQQILKKR